MRWASDDPQAEVTRSCMFDVDTMIPESPDGSYTPPPPDATLLQAINKASGEDYNDYCDSWNPSTGFEQAEEEENTCGPWQADYYDLHQQRLEQLQRLKAGDFESFGHESPPAYVSYLCASDPKNRGSHGCGGLADRMNGNFHNISMRHMSDLFFLGMVSTFFYALLTDRAYLANWQDPLPLETLFEKPSIDWSFEPSEMRELFNKKGDSYLSYQSVNTLNQKWGPIGRTVFPEGPSQDFKKLWKASVSLQ